MSASTAGAGRTRRLSLAAFVCDRNLVSELFKLALCVVASPMSLIFSSASSTFKIGSVVSLTALLFDSGIEGVWLMPKLADFAVGTKNGRDVDAVLASLLSPLNMNGRGDDGDAKNASIKGASVVVSAVVALFNDVCCGWLF